jgi:hypothetical protein
MKKVLLTGAALVAVATSPAMAEGLKLDLAGHAKVYGVYNNNDEAAGQSLDELNIRKETEVHFTGETTLDSGLTVGAHVELIWIVMMQTLLKNHTSICQVDGVALTLVKKMVLLTCYKFLLLQLTQT